MNNDRIGTWYGKDVEDLSKEELLEVVRYLLKRRNETRDAIRYRWLRDRVNSGGKWILMRKEPSGLWDQMPRHELDQIIDTMAAE